MLWFALLAGCAKPPVPPPPKPPSVLTVRVGAGAHLNPDLRARPSPVVLRLYELKSASQFDAADFVSLYDKDQATLGADVVARDEIVLRPSETKIISKPLGADTKVVAAVAAFREIEQARWRAWAPVVVGKNNLVVVDLDSYALQIVAGAQKP